jgi:hypothetical protein
VGDEQFLQAVVPAWKTPLLGSEFQGRDRWVAEIKCPGNMEVLHRLGRLAAAQDVRDTDFGTVFDLPPA